MKTKKTPKLRYWLSKDYFIAAIRVEWSGPAGLQTSTARLHTSPCGYKSLSWGYDVPPEPLDELALACALVDGEHDVEGAEHMGHETLAQMDDAVFAVYGQEAA